MRNLLVLIGLGGLAGCAVEHNSIDPGARTVYAPDVQVTRPPYTEVHANWKQRLDQPYVFLEHRGDYRLAGKQFEALATAMRAAEITASGPPFILFYDDPAVVPIAELRARVCLPVSGPVDVSGTLRYELLPSTTVVYAVVSGPYPEVPRAYPGLYGYLQQMNWVEAGPLREIYLVQPGLESTWDELLCEVQIPATQKRN